MEWHEAQRLGHRLVFRNTEYLGVEREMTLARIATRALVVGLDADWVELMLADGLEQRIAEATRMKLN